ncbi:hypothetical protein P692DRAFT_201215310 [Suillus brevipes Sb2]|nr:hypothetical protein P692DRAFT_201215310 [Suillus brevipes Sb2]
MTCCMYILLLGSFNHPLLLSLYASVSHHYAQTGFGRYNGGELILQIQLQLNLSCSCFCPLVVTTEVFPTSISLRLRPLRNIANECDVVRR